MDSKNVTLRTNEIAYQTINNSIDAAKNFIMVGLTDVAIAELDHLKRLIKIQSDAETVILKNYQRQLGLLED